MIFDLTTLEAELKQRLTEPYYPWGRKQSNDWDDKTNFIYTTPSYNGLKNKAYRLPSELYKYAVNRWFNFWSAMGVEAIFCQLPGVVAATERDRLKDFSIQGISFDHKTTVYPKNYGHSPDYAKTHPGDLTEWLYRNQSTERRYHLSNRLFIVLHSLDGQHWKLRAELKALKSQIERYVDGFDVSNLIRLQLNGANILTDVILFKG